MLEGAGTHEGWARCTMGRGGSCVREGREDETNVALVVVLAAVVAVVVGRRGCSFFRRRLTSKG
jgi:hypothetical protein